ncbi:MAG: YdcF family protein [Verrucomicrobiota bacterium]
MACAGLIQRKEIWFPTRQGWLVLGGVVALVVLGTMVGAVPFLSTTRPMGGDVLVVEGWLPDYALAETKQIFEARGYRLLLVTGIPIDQGTHLSQETNYAFLASNTLKHMGLLPGALVPIACPDVARNRTYATARKVREWLDAHPGHAKVDVTSLGVHSRRTWLLYRLALGQRYETGIFAARDQRYDDREWWKTSGGFRIVTSEIIAFIYAKLLFYPHWSKTADGDPI